MKKYYLPILLFILSVLISVIFIITASGRRLSDTENILFQIFALSLGIGSSYLFGTISAKDAALEIIKPHARSSFRRLVSLYKSLGRLIQTINDRKSQNDVASYSAALDLVEAVAIEQLASAGDAMEDWRDIVPEEVDELVKRIENREII
jgi:hypothetical protein